MHRARNLWTNKLCADRLGGRRWFGSLHTAYWQHGLGRIGWGLANTWPLFNTPCVHNIGVRAVASRAVVSTRNESYYARRIVRVGMHCAGAVSPYAAAS